MEEGADAFNPRSEQLILEIRHRELPRIGVAASSVPSELKALCHRKFVLNCLAQPRCLFNDKCENGNAFHWNRDGSQPRSTASRKLQAGVVSVR